MSKSPIITLTPSGLDITATVEELKEILDKLDPNQIMEVSTTASNEAMPTAAGLKLAGYEVGFDVDAEAELTRLEKPKNDKAARLTKAQKEEIEGCFEEGKPDPSSDWIADQVGVTVEQVERYLKKRNKEV